MTVDITQDEMNILNLNGISADEIRSNVEYMRATGLDDVAIRKQYTDTIYELIPLTKQSYNDSSKIKEWQAKGGITPFEYANKRAVEFKGSYNNIDDNANLSSFEQKLKNSPRNAAVEERIAKNAQAKVERDKRVNEGTASFLDRASAALDRWGNESYQAQTNAPDDVVVKMSGVNNPVDKSGKINFTESLGNSFMTGEWIPFIGGFIKGADDKKEREIREHILNGEPIRQDELNYLNHRLEEKQEEAVRGYTWGGNVANGFLPSLIRFSGEIYTGGWVLKGLGLTPELSAGATLGTKATHALSNMGKYGAAGAILPTSWNDTYQNFQERLLNNGFEFTDKGSYIFKESDEKPAISFLKSLGQTFVMFASETSGELLNIPVQGATSAASKYIGTPISKYIMAQPKIANFVNKVLPELSKYYEKINKLKPKGAAYEFLKDSVKFDGLLEEMGEEVVEDVLNLTLGTTDEKRSLENYSKAIFKSPDEWAIIAGAIALQGGTLSVASHTLGSYMERNGASQEEILEVMQNLSETEKEQKISELATEGLINVTKYKNEDLDQRAELKNKYFTQLKNAGKEDDEAIQEASLMSEIIANSAKEWNISLDEAEKKFAITLQNMTDEKAIEQWQSDNSTALQGRVIFNANQTIENKLNQIYEEYDKLPEDFSDMYVINKYIDDMQTLESIKDGTIEDTEKAQNLIKEYEQSDPDLARALKDAMQGGIKLHTQSIDKDNIEKNFGDTTENITKNVKADILNILKENVLDESEFNFEDIRVYGSYSTGKNKATSDLDFIVQYSGSMREDDAFNMLNDQKLTIEDVNGRTVEIDINPINVATSGTIDENLKYFDSLQPKLQSIEAAGAENNQTALAKQEWKKKGTESKFFKKWFGNSKVVDENGKALVVYHGTESDEQFEVFETGRPDGIDAIYFSSSKNTAKSYSTTLPVYRVYLKIENPFIVDAQGQEYNNFIAEMRSNLDWASRNDYDGIIVKNIRDGWSQNKGGEIADTYIVFNPEQIKSVNNQGTFDENNPNIYFQSAAMKRSRFANFKDFYNDVLSKPKNSNKKEQFNALSKGGINLRIPHDTVIHEQKKHKLSAEQWQDLLNNIDDVSRAELSKQKARFNGKPVLLKVNTLYNTFGVVIETFEKNNPIITTAFIDTEKNINNWLSNESIKNEAIPSGTKTSFLGNRLKNIITQIQPKFKPFDIYIYYQGENINGDLRNDIENARGFTYQRFNFDGTVKDNLITLLNNKADKSTLLHEFAHVYLTTLTNMAKENERAKSMLLTVNKWLRYDGIEYTTAQHEKFANGFVAYVRSGKAPTYGLKLAFENFRKWLNDLYTTISNNDDLSLDQETEKVFEELLGDISFNAQKKAASDIIDRAKRYAEIRFKDEGLKNEIDQNQLTDTQRRYRDTAYDIIYYALSHSKAANNFIKNRQQLVMILGNRNKAVGKRNIGIKKQAERIFEILSELDDEFSANDGFSSEWGEFFNNPGVSYNNKKVGADAELAIEAYRVITEERYLYVPGEDFSEFGVLTEEEIQKNEYELEFILNEYRDAEDKTIPLFAYYELQDNLHPYIQEDFAKKWEAQSNEIDRYQALSKFDQAKEDLKIYAATLKGHGDYSTQFAEYARAILKRLDFMPELDKARIFDKLKEFNSFREIERNLDDVMDYAETIAAVSERKQLANDIDREIKQTIHEWKNGIKKTKYTYPANKLFTRLREISKMKQEQVQDLYDELANDEGEITYEADAVNNEDYFVTIEKMFITFKANGSYYNSTEFLTDLLNRIQGAKFSAKLARDEIDFERRMAQITLIDECARAVDKHKGKVSDLEKAYRHAFNLNSALEMMFNKSIKSRFSLDYLYAQRDAKVGKDRNEVLEKLAHVYGFNGKFRDIQLFNKFIDMTKKEFKIKQRYTPDKVNGTYRITHTDKESGRTFTDRVINLLKRENYKEWEDEPIKLSRMELLYYYIQAKNPISYNMLTHMGDETTPAKGQFDKFEFDNLLENLTDQEKLMGDILQMAAEKYYPELNRYHIKKYHVDLGKVSCYFPRKSETQDVKMLEMFNQYAQLNTNQKFQKQRTAGAGVRIAPANPLAVLFDHIEKSNTLIIMGEQLDLMNSVFKDADLSRKIKAVWGDETAKEFMQQVTSNLYGGQMSSISEAESFIGSISNNVIKSQIFLKPQVGLKQVISFMNYGVGDDYVTPKEWMKKFAAQTFTPQEWKNNIKYMMNIPYLKDRFSRGGSTDALKRQLEQRLFAKISLFDNILSANVRYGDIGAIILGGKPYIDCLLDKGYTEEQAIKIFIEKTVNDQQSSIPSTLSNIQRNASHQPLAKMIFAYQNTPWQYFRTASNAIIRFKQNPNKQTGMNMAKLVSLYLFVFPLIFNMASSLSPLIFAIGGGDDDMKADFWKSVIGGITFIPFAGMFINTIYSGFRGEKASTGNWFDTAAGKMGGIARHISKGEVTPLDIFQAISLFGEASTGLPLTTAGTELSGAWNILTGELAKGAIKMSGYTDYRAKKVTGQED